MSQTDTPTPQYTVPGMDRAAAAEVADLLQNRLVALIDLTLTLKHIHWNVVGPTFISVHEMLDPQYAGVSAMVDDVAERIATLGSEPNGLPGNLVARRQSARTRAGHAKRHRTAGSPSISLGSPPGSAGTSLAGHARAARRSRVSTVERRASVNHRCSSAATATLQIARAWVHESSDRS